MDFERLLSEAGESAPVEPRELYASLPDKAVGYGYLRDVQGQVLTAWHQRRDERDLVVKVNTGGGKTIDGLVILQSYLNEGLGPALYVTPSNFLVDQVREEAERLSIPTVGDPDHRRYLAGEAIAVVNADKLVNGRSVFSNKRPTRAPAPIGSVVIDDAHAAIPITRKDLSLELPRTHPAFQGLFDLFADDIRSQAPNAYLDVQEESFGALARVPFWAWRTKAEQARSLLHLHRETSELKFAWPAVRDVLHLCRAVFAGTAVTITPPCPPIRHVTGFMEAKRRLYLTATLADDSVLVTDFAADPEGVKEPIVPVTAGDIGERMILAPQEINPALAEDDVRASVAALASEFNVVVIVPSDKSVSPWRELGATVAAGEQVGPVVASLKAGHLGLVVLVNRYDGVDLPDDACRVLVLDGLPEAFSGDERLQTQLTSRSAGIDDRQVQRIEQGMGRGVRSNEDHCVVILLGSRLGQLVADPRSLARFGSATRAQLELSRTVARGLEDQPLDKVIGVARQALDRDPAWVKLARLKLSKLPAPTATLSPAATSRRQAFEAAADGDYQKAANCLSDAINAAESDREKGWLLEEQASYLDHIEPHRAQQVLVKARAKNSAVLRPLSGVNYQRLSSSDDQARNAVTHLKALYETPAALRLGFEAFLDDLRFDPSRTNEFEEALRMLGEHLGLAAERPELEVGAGPDVLWGLGSSTYWVIEAKSGAASQIIHKRDANQLSGSANWFNNRYNRTARGVPVMIHPARILARDASATPGMRVLVRDGLDRLKAATREFAAGLASTDWQTTDHVNKLLAGHHLRSNELHQYLKEVQPPR